MLDTLYVLSQVALSTANELSRSGVAYVENNKGSLPPLAQKSVDLILASPAKLKEITAEVAVNALSCLVSSPSSTFGPARLPLLLPGTLIKHPQQARADLDSSKRTLENVANLLGVLHDAHNAFAARSHNQQKQHATT